MKMILAKDFISKDLFVAKMKDSIIQVLKKMKSYNVSMIPVVDNNEFKGIINENNITAFDKNKQLKDIEKYLIKPYFVYADEHIYDVIYQMSDFSLCLIPILDRQQNWLGNITWQEIFRHIDRIVPITQPGGIIILEVEKRNYSLKELTHIIEMENTKIINLSIYQHSEYQDKIMLTIKLNTLDLDAVLQSLLRFEYNIYAHFSQGEKLTEKIKKRYNLLMRYLEV